MQQEEVVRRRVRDDRGYRQRRGSIKSRILQFSKKRKKEPPDKFSDNEESDSAIQSRTITPKSACALPTLEEQDLESIEVEVHETQPFKFDTNQPLLVLKDPQTAITSKVDPINATNSDDFQKLNAETIGVVDKHLEPHVFQLHTKPGGSIESKHAIPLRPSNLNVNNEISEQIGETRPEVRKSMYDYSFISSCSVPSGGTTTSSPSPTEQSLFLSQPQEPKILLRRHSRNVINNSHESGRLLNSALARHFRSLHCNGANIASDASATVLSENLYNYIKDVFLQLDSHHSGYVSRQDFEALCEILQIDKSPPVSKRNSGLQWLSSYQPRPNTPASPIRMDRLSEAKYKHTGPKPPMADPTSFLWTIGPRPFWEMWPHKKYKKRNLNLEDFMRSLLQQWAKTHGYPMEMISESKLSKLIIPSKQLAGENSPKTRCFVHDEDDTRIQKLKRSVVRLTKRYHKEERISRKSSKGVEGTNGIASNTVNGQRSKYSNGHTNGNTNGHTNGNTNGHTNGNTNGHSNGHTNGNTVNVSKDKFTSAQRFKIKKPSFLTYSKRIEKLEKQVADQQMEIQSLTGVVEHLRVSLQLSDAQNLALQVLLKKMSKAESKLPAAEPSDFRNQMKQSEQQLENLVSELKEMSQTKYPTIPRNIYSGSNCSFNGAAQGDLGIEEESENNHESLSSVQRDITSAQNELRDVTKQIESKKSKIDDLSLAEAYEALLKTEKEIEKLRSDLSAAQSSFENTHSDLLNTKKELKETKQCLSERTIDLLESNKRLSQLNENRKSLLHELKSTKEVLISSLRNVQDLETESQKVPYLQTRLQELESLLPLESSGRIQFVSPTHLDDSFLYGSSEGDSEECLTSSHPELSGKSSDHGLPPRPPSSKSKDKSFRSTTPTSEKLDFSPTPSSGHYSAGSTPIMPKSPADKSDSVIRRLRREIDQLKNRFSTSEREWAEERNSLLNELNRRREDYGDTTSYVQDLREERIRLALIEEKIKEILSVLKSLNSMNISHEVLGNLVLEAVEKAYDQTKGEVEVFIFLNILYQSTRDYERQSADNLLTEALDAVKDSNSDSSDSLGNVPEGMDTIRPRRPSANIKDPNLESVFRIDV